MRNAFYLCCLKAATFIRSKKAIKSIVGRVEVKIRAIEIFSYY